ncbi:MAG: NADH-quinone oxidoreductase subunit M [Acidimicrobiia bacterium]|jgi:NADH-quinone oxidoreductase subunit M
MLTWLILVPALAAAAVMVLPRRRGELFLPVGFALSLIPVALAGVLFFEFRSGVAEFQFVQRAAWYEPWGIGWNLGVDGISLGLVVLTTVLVPVALAASTTITHRVKEFVAMVLFLEAGLLGVFLSLDLFIFFVFFEAILIPMYFIIGVWGSERRIYAAVKFFLYTALGSAFMLAAIIALGFQAADQLGAPTFDFVRLLTLELDRSTQLWLFIAFGLAFGIKVPLFPFHTWLPDAHVEAPTAGSVLLAGVLLKLGTYGFLRFNLTLFPQATVDLVPVLAVLAVIGIIYGAVVAIVQPDLKKLVAYSSVSHLGFIVLGTFALTYAGLQGAVIQNINHGLTTGALFLLVGMIYDRRHTKKIADFGGLAKVMPVYAGLFLFTAFASIGLPGLNGFVGEFLVLIGSYPSLPVAAAIAAFGVVLAAVYLLWAYERVFTGEPDKEENRLLSDLGGREIGIMIPLVVLIVVLGLYPKILLDRSAASTEAILDRIEATTEYRVPYPGRLADVYVAGGDE